MTHRWDIVPGEHEGTRKSLIISLILGAIIMVFIFTVFPMIRVVGTAPTMPASFKEVLVDIVRAKEQERQQPEEEQVEEEEAPQEEAPQRREVAERRAPRERTREVRSRPETQDLALQQEVDLNLQRQRSDRSQRRDRDMGSRQTRDRAASDIVVPRSDASLETSNAPRASVGRGDRATAGRRSVRGTGRASLEVGAGPEVNVEYEPQVDGDVEQDVSPVIDWLKGNSRSVPRDLLEPEYFNYQSGDLTSQITFVGSDGKEYTIYLLGRESDPPELKIFIVQGTSGVLLTDIGAQGTRSESLQAGRVLIRGDRMSLQMSQISPGDPRADESMQVFQDWWNSQ